MRRRLRIGPLVLIALSLCVAEPFVALADGFECDQAITQAQMNRCAAQRFQMADEDLNHVYLKALERLSGAQERDAFRRVQRSWLTYRDSHCEFMREQYRGGSIAPLIYSDCMAALTKARTQDIIAIFPEWETP